MLQQLWATAHQGIDNRKTRDWKRVTSQLGTARSIATEFAFRLRFNCDYTSEGLLSSP